MTTQDTDWPCRDFVAFRDHVARHVEIKPSRLELREGRHAIAMTLIEDTRQEQAQLDPDSQKYADPEWVNGAFMDVTGELQEDIKALKTSRLDMVTTAR